MAKITFILDDGEKVEVPLAGDLTIGRVEGNDIVVDDPRISSQHAEVKRLDGGNFEVRDLDSKGGTLVNGEPVTVRKLAHGDKISFGPLSAEFEVEGLEATIIAPATIAPAPPAEDDATEKELERAKGKQAARLPAKKEKDKLKGGKSDESDSPADDEAMAAKAPEAGVPRGEEAARKTASEAPVVPVKEGATDKDKEEKAVETVGPAKKEATSGSGALSAGDKLVGAVTLSTPPPLPPVEKPEASTPAPQDEVRLVADPFAKLQADVEADMEKLKEVRRQQEKETETARANLESLKSEHAELSQKCAEMKRVAEADERRLENLRAQITSGDEQYRDITGQIHSATERIASLKTEEKRLGPVREELLDAETKHGEWLTAIAALSVDYDAKNAEVQRLTAGSENALRELEALTANKEQMSVQLLTLLKDRETQESALAELRKQFSDVEARYQSVQQLTDARDDQVKTAERKLHTLEQQRQAQELRLKELVDTEGKLKAARTLLQESDAKQAALTAALTVLSTRHKSNDEQVAVLDKRLLELRQEQTTAENRVAEARKELAAGERALDEFRAKSAATQKHLEGTTTEAEKQLATRKAELAVETKRLEEVRTERLALETQCQALANTDMKLAEAKAGLQQAGSQRIEIDAWIKELETKRVAAQNVVDGLHLDEEVTKGRLEVLRGREKDLRTQLDDLAERERSERDRFEEIRRLAVEADKEHKARMEELQRTIELTRRDLADMEMKLAPLREWKDAMDKRYTRLASLPEDSAEARELFKEIEAEKVALRNLVSVPEQGTARGIAPGEAVLRGINPQDEEGAAVEGAEGEESKAQAGKAGKGPGKKGKLHAPEEILDAETPQERAHVGTTGTGAMLSGTGQEMALKARLTRIRESVQREAARLEFLRQERAREETRGKAGTTSGDAMLREQERQLENKVRREEEKLAALERKLENAGMEEEKRRERLAEMERKLTELKADITEHERVRSDSLHAADLARKEVANLEETVERLRTMGDGEPYDGTKSGPVPMTTKSGPVTTVGGSKLKTMVSGRSDS